MTSHLKVEESDVPFDTNMSSESLQVNIKAGDVFEETEDDVQFNNELQYQDVQDDRKDIISNLLDGDGQIYEEGGSESYQEIEQGEHSEQFLTIPRGKTQIAVCDNGSIVYTNDGLLETITTENLKQDSDASYYYQDATDTIEAMETAEDANETSEYVEELSQEETLSEVEPTGNITFLSDDNEIVGDPLEIDASLDTLTEIKKSVQHVAHRGIKRAIPPASQNKNYMSKVFIQNTAEVKPGPSQPIKIMGNVGSVVGGRSMSLAQAQKLGLISPSTKIQRVVQAVNAENPGQRMIVKRVVGGSSVLAIKQPTKILPAPTGRSPIVTARSQVSPSNITPVRSTVSLSQVKTYNALTTTASQVRPVSITRTVSGVTLGRTDQKTPQKILVRAGNNVLSPIPGQITRFPASFQPIQIAGKPNMQFVKFVSNASSMNTTSITSAKPRFVKAVGSRTVPIAPISSLQSTAAQIVGRRIFLPSTNDGELTEVQIKSPSIIPLTIKGKTYTAIKSNTTDEAPSSGNIVVVPAPDESTSQDPDEVEEGKEYADVEESDNPSVMEASGMRPKKPCNCTKSQCLKLYCECFANGEFCFQCNCNNCFNNIEHEEERQTSIKSCLERNPSAFRPKFQIGSIEDEDRRNKGCNCRRSGCLKNYCECFEAKITCSKMCKCIGCKNNEDDVDSLDKFEGTESGEEGESGNKVRFMSPSLTEALCQCILAQAEAAERKGDDMESAERRIIEEFGQCLVQIIGNRNKREAR